MRLQVLLVEDDRDDWDLKQDLESFFARLHTEAEVHLCGTFEEAHALTEDPSRRFDLVVSDTYRGDPGKQDAAVMEMVRRYQAGRFCPLVVYSSSVRPPDLTDGPFLVWADKTKANDIECAIKELLTTGIPQLSRALHDELDETAGSYLWAFLEENWERLQAHGFDRQVCERLIRRRAAVRISQIVCEGGEQAPIGEVDGVEYYVYPPLNTERHCLGEVIRKRENAGDLRVILTPHCHLDLHPGQDAPRAESVLTVRTRSAAEVLGQDKVEHTRGLTDTEQKHKKLKAWATVPSRQAVGKPEGRFWYLPRFLEIPHLYCDFQLVESMPYTELSENWEPIAVLAPPFAESLQACFVSYHSSVGLPDIRPASIENLLEPT